MSEILRLSNISKTFPGVKALANVSFDLKRGEAHCLCGENGAGKSTLIKILSGAYQPDEGGEIRLKGEPVRLTPRSALQMGIHTIYQEHVSFNDLDITENIFTGAEISRWGFQKRGEMRRRTQEVLNYLKSDLSPDVRVRSLTSGQRKIVEIAKALIFKSDVIILDEPTASFSSTEIDTVLDIVRTLKRDGIGVIYISHHLEEVYAIGDRATVLRDGQKVSVHPVAGLPKSTLIRDMVGRDPSSFYQREHIPAGDPVLEVRNLSGNGVHDISFILRRGEVLGFAGMVGCGRSELMEMLFGAVRPTDGDILLNGIKVTHSSPADAIQNGMCFITEDRQHSGLLLDKSISDNIAVANMTVTGDLLVRPAREEETAEGYIRLLGIKAPDAQVKAVNLSGGNQQKVVLSKWFNTGGEIFILDEPSHGVDVGAKQDIYRVTVELLKQGKAVLMVSSDMPEVISMSDRVLVLRKGRITGELSGADITEENILGLSIGDDEK